MFSPPLSRLDLFLDEENYGRLPMGGKVGMNPASPAQWSTGPLVRAARGTSRGVASSPSWSSPSAALALPPRGGGSSSPGRPSRAEVLSQQAEAAVTGWPGYMTPYAVPYSDPYGVPYAVPVEGPPGLETIEQIAERVVRDMGMGLGDQYGFDEDVATPPVARRDFFDDAFGGDDDVATPPAARRDFFEDTFGASVPAPGDPGVYVPSPRVPRDFYGRLPSTAPSPAYAAGAYGNLPSTAPSPAYAAGRYGAEATWSERASPPGTFAEALKIGAGLGVGFLAVGLAAGAIARALR